MLKLITIAALLGFGFQIMLGQGMIFEWYSKWLVNNRRRYPGFGYFAKPLGMCIICNTTWIGIMMGLYYGLNIIESLIIGGSAGGLVTLINVLYTKIFNSLDS